ncbi:MAG: lysylphosphatidylglycerol synthase transmembrane domain-containing protein [Steroidobacteraceae bacterium]
MTRRLLWLLAGLGLASAFLWLSLRGIDLPAVLATLHRAGAAPALMAVLCSVLFMFVKAVRWTSIIADTQRAPLRVLHAPVWAGTAVNLLISHLGEIYRVAAVRRATGLAASFLLPTIGAERLFDFLTLLVMLALIALGYVIDHQQLPPILAAAGVIIAAFAAAIGVGVLLLLLRPDSFIATANRLLIPFPSKLRAAVGRWLKLGAAGLKPLADPRRVAGIMMLSVLQWGCIAASIWFCCCSAGFTASLPACLSVLLLTTVGASLPTAPAYLGTTQIGFTAGLELVQIAPAPAFAASLIYTLTVIVPPLVVGSLLALRGSLSLDTAQGNSARTLDTTR